MRYQIFGERTGLKVSELALGTGMFGQTWGYGATPEDAKRIIEGFADAGGNFIDTADNYQHGVSETLIGDFLASNRDDFVIASKFTRGASDDPALARLGNNRKNMVQSVEASLKRLKTDRIDLYFAHMDDFVTPMEEIARGLDDLVRAGKICLWRPVQLSRVARGHCRRHGRPPWLDARLRNPDRIQSPAAHTRSGSAAHGRRLRHGRDGLTLAHGGWNY